MIGALIGLAFIAGMLAGWAALPLLIVIATLLWFLEQFSPAALALALLAACMGVLRAPGSIDTSLNPDFGSFTRQPVEIVGSVVDNGRWQQLRIETQAGDVLCVITTARTDLGRGDHLSVDFEANHPTDIDPGLQSWFASRGCDWSGSLTRITVERQGSGIARRIDDIRKSITRQFTDWLPGDRGALLAGLVIGDDALLSPSSAEAFRSTGTLHVVAISGSNLSLLAAILVPVFAWLPRRWLNEIVALAIVWLYVIVGGANPPTVRAGILASMAAGGRLVGRPVDLLTLSLQVAAIQVAIQPHAINGLSFRMTTVAILVVIVTIAGRRFDRFWTSLGLAVLTTITVQIALLPLLPAGMRPNILTAVLANLLISPFITIAFALGLISICVAPVVPVAGEALAIIAGECNGITLRIVESLAGWNLPHWSAPNAPLPAWIPLVFAVAVIALVSKEFRRTAADAWSALDTNRAYAAPLILSLGLGGLAGSLAVALFA